MRNCRKIKRLKCGQHVPALPVSLNQKESALLEQGDPGNSTPVRRLNQAHNRSHESQRHCWEQCKFERSSRDFREKYSGQAYQSPARGRFSPWLLNSYIHHSPHKIDAHKQFCVQVGCACSKWGGREVHTCYPVRQVDHLYKVTFQHCLKGTHGASSSAEYDALLFASLNEASVNPETKTSIYFDNVYTGALPELVIVGLVSDADLAGGYKSISLNFKNFCVNLFELKRNGTSVPRRGYIPDFANGKYLKVYMTFLQELECDTGDKTISFTPSDWAKRYTLYAVKITHGPIGPGTYGPRSKSATGSVRLESFIWYGSEREHQGDCILSNARHDRVRPIISRPRSMNGGGRLHDGEIDF